MTACVCVASGPSFTEEQALLIDAAHKAGKIHLAVVNENWRRFPDADLLYAADPRWWKRYHAEVFARFRGECWTCVEETARQYGLCHIRIENGIGLSTDPSFIWSGYNSGYQMIGLVHNRMQRPPVETDPLILAGFDMMRGPNFENHHHADYTAWQEPGQKQPTVFSNASGVDTWATYFPAMVADAKRLGVKIVNCSLRTALTFERADLAQTLASL